MPRDWELWLRTAAQPASRTEEQARDRTLARVRAALQASPEIPSSVRIYVKGSYATNTNVRGDADVDIAVEWTSVAYVNSWGETAGLLPDQLGYTPVPFDITPRDFRSRIERALISALGTGPVDTTPDKRIDVRAGSTTLDADVVPCFEMHRYDAPRRYAVGHRLFPRSGGYIDNFPQQNYDNGVAKNTATGRRFKEIVRCIKRLEGELLENRLITREYPGYLIECLTYNVPNDRFRAPQLYDTLQVVFDWLWDATNAQQSYDALLEVNELLMLFRGHRDRSPRNAHTFIDTAWRYINA